MKPEIKFGIKSSEFIGFALILFGCGCRIPWSSGSSPPIGKFLSYTCIGFGIMFLFIKLCLYIHECIQKIVSDRLNNDEVKIRNASLLNNAIFDEENKLIELKRKGYQCNSIFSYRYFGSKSSKKVLINRYTLKYRRLKKLYLERN